VRTDFSYGAFAAITNEPTTGAGEAIQPPGSGVADLLVQSLEAFGRQQGGVVVQAVVKNQGDRATTNGFYTDLYVDHVPSGPGDYTGSISFWVDDSIDPGATVTLTGILTDVTGLAGRTNASPLSETSITLYTQADSDGVVTEPDDQNNVSAGLNVCVASADQYEGDNSATAAQWISPGSPQIHNFDRIGDQDWVKFSAEAGTSYVLYTSHLADASDTYLYLYDTDGTTVLAANDDYGTGLASRIEWVAPAAGTYYAMVRHWNPSVGGCGTSYTLHVGYRSTIYLSLVIKRHT